MHKVLYYTKGVMDMMFPKSFFPYDCEKELANYSEEEQRSIWENVHFYNQVDRPFELSRDAINLFHCFSGKNTAYKTDLTRLIKYFGKDRYFDSVMGDINYELEHPAFTKARPVIEGRPQDGILLNLNSVRHYTLKKDELSLDQKENNVIFRGRRNNEGRVKAIEAFGEHPKFNIAVTRGRRSENYVSVSDQLRYKFILSIEGMDVATNLKWIMASNSICVMRRPRVESWFRERTLVPGRHYIEVADDYSDLEEKIQPYIDDSSLANEMVKNAQAYVAQFFDKSQEKLIGYLVVKKYFDLLV